MKELKNMKTYPCVLTIAGSDPSGGAGVQADIKAISATGAYAASVITVLPAQNTQGVQAILEIPPDFVRQQIESVLSDLDVHAIKIGMLYHSEIIKTVKNSLAKFKPVPIIVDPVMMSKNGCELLPAGVIEDLKAMLFSRAYLITPNIPEAEKILDIEIINTIEMEAAAIKIGKEFKTSVLLKGGHLETANSSDVLYLQSEDKCYWFHGERIDTQNTHGTGCTLSSAIASYIAQDYGLLEAVSAAKRYLSNAIQAGSEFRLGHGHGPVHHFYHFNRESKS
jgi:hydroxymethylpyrimidine/phosphomethylpyrimidine kinase